MKLERAQIKNFRLLKDIDISLEDKTTVIVGRNNAGKTSLTELFRRLLADSTPSFTLSDFNLSIHEDFWSSFLLQTQGSDEATVREALPYIEVALSFSYDSATANLGTLSDFIIDLDPDSKTANTVIRYELQDGKIDSFFEGLTYVSDGDELAQRKVFFKAMTERISRYYSTALFVVDPTDATNKKSLELSKLKTLLRPGFIIAQRRLDETSSKDRDVLGRILEKMLGTARSEDATPEDKTTAKALEDAVQDIQQRMDMDFNEQLNKLLPTLEKFGYPGLGDSQLQTETILDVERLLQNHTKLTYPGANGVGLPEGYNGLGTRNLIYILFQLFEFFKSYQAASPAPGVHLVFIEEPEAHLHPQMQEVFISKINEIADAFSDALGEGLAWPVQFVVTTHSSHVANKASFESIRYFLCSSIGGNHTRVKDLREGLKGEGFEKDAEFLRKYLTLTRCDLFFADKAMLIEGPTERILMPRLIEIIDSDPANTQKLSTQYLSVVEVGGAYAHHFLRLLDFLELRTLIITDIDASKKVVSADNKTTYPKSRVAQATNTSNGCLKAWFSKTISPADLIAKSEVDKIKGTVRVAYQIPEATDGPCGRSFEDAFMLTNSALFGIGGTTSAEKADYAWDVVDKIGKTDFALKYAIDETNWVIPRYIKEGLLWLAESPLAPAPNVAEEVTDA